MAYKKIQIHPFKLENRIALFRTRANKTDFKIVMDHLNHLKNGEITGRAITEARQRKLIDLFSIFFNNYKKSLSKITKNDLRAFKEKLVNDDITKLNGEPYSEGLKEDLTEGVARLLEITFPEKIESFRSPTLPFRKWFIIKAKKKTPETLSEAEIIKLLESSKTIEGKFLICVLFSSGCRIEEFLNLRFEDIEEPTQNFPYYRFDFKDEYSKTNGRKIGLYWRDSTEIISKYLASCENKESKEQIFPKNYDAVRMFLIRLGKKTLSKRVYPHLLRKASATFYADKLNRQELCIRYGWKFSSPMPDVYISRAGLDEEKIKERVLNTDLGKIQQENREMKIKLKLMNTELKANAKKQRDNVEELKRLYAEIKSIVKLK